MAITSANGFAVGDKVSLVATATVGGDTSSVVLNRVPSRGDLRRQIDVADDEANTQDEYSVQWFKNGAPVTSGRYVADDPKLSSGPTERTSSRRLRCPNRFDRRL